jgi:hypothetical protein
LRVAFFEQRLQLRDRGEVARPARGALDFDEGRQIEAETSNAERFDRCGVPQEVLIAAEPTISPSRSRLPSEVVSVKLRPPWTVSTLHSKGGPGGAPRKYGCSG